MFIPYRVDVPMHRWPVANAVIVFLALIAFGWQQSLRGLEQFEQLQYVLNGWSLKGLFGHMWLHADPLHLIGNMLFLWVFGNAVCAKVGNGVYAIAYVVFGLAAATAFNLTSDGRMIGASGAINGVVGAFLVLYPLNNTSCLFILFFRFIRFNISSIWMILFWLTFDIWGAARGDGNVAYFAHLGGFAAGFGLCTLALKLNWLKMEPDERSLFDLIKHGRTPQRFRERQRRPEELPEQQTARRDEPRGPKTMLETMRSPGPAEQAGARVPPSRPPQRPPEPSGTIPRPPGQAQAPSPPPPADTVRMKCVCGKHLRVPRSLGGQQATCPACKQVIQIPEL